MYLVGLVIFLILFAYLELVYARRVDGISMLPTLEEGDAVVVLNVPYGDIHQGDIIVYDPPCSATGYSVIHRVVEITSGGFITRGDNNPGTDQALRIAASPITPECLDGKVVFAFPYIERLSLLPYGTNYLLALLIIFAVLFSEFRNRGQDRPQEESEEGAKLLPELEPAKSQPPSGPLLLSLQISYWLDRRAQAVGTFAVGPLRRLHREDHPAVGTGPQVGHCV